jgi:hypothetical protein
MRRLLLTIFLIMAIFQMVVLATAIDVGFTASDRAKKTPTNTDFTFVDNANSANATGKITSIDIWAGDNMTNCEVATFYVVSGNNLSTRDTQAIGSVTAGSKQTFIVDLDVTTGDYIGIYFSTGGSLDYDTGLGGTEWYQNGDLIPCTNAEFNLENPGATMSLYGTGATTATGGNAIMMGINF